MGIHVAELKNWIVVVVNSLHELITVLCYPQTANKRFLHPNLQRLQKKKNNF